MVQYRKPVQRSSDLIDRRQTARFQGLANRARIKAEREREELLARALAHAAQVFSGAAKRRGR